MKEKNAAWMPRSIIDVFEGKDEPDMFNNIRYFEPDYTGLSHYLENGEYVTDFL